MEKGCIHLLNTCKYCDNTCKYCGNTNEYWPKYLKNVFTCKCNICEYCHNTCFEAILMYFKACGRSFLWNWLLCLIVTEKYWLNICEYYHNTYKYCHNTCEYWVLDWIWVFLRKVSQEIKFFLLLSYWSLIGH